MKLDYYLPCRYDQQIALLRRIEALWEMIGHLLTPMLRGRPPTPSQVVTLRLRRTELQIIVSARLFLPPNSHSCEFC